MRATAERRLVVLDKAISHPRASDSLQSTEEVKDLPPFEDLGQEPLSQQN